MMWMRSALVIALGTLLFTACNNDDDNDFRFDYSGVYVIQNNDGEVPLFSPYVLYKIENGTLKSGSVKLGTTILAGAVLAPDFYETAPAYTSSLGEVNGKYELTAMSGDNQTITDNLYLQINEDKPLGEMVVIEFSYENGDIVAKIENVENANLHGLYFNPVVSGNPITSRRYAWTEEYLVESGVTMQSFRFPFSSANMEYDEIRISPSAMRASANGTLVLQGQERILKKGATDFEPIPGN